MHRTLSTYMRRAGFCIGLSLAFTASHLHAHPAQKNTQAQPPHNNLTLTSDTVTCEHDKNTCTAVGNVHVVHHPKDQLRTPSSADTTGSYTLDAAQLTVHFTAANKNTKTPSAQSTTGGMPGETTSIEKLHATGRVKIVRDDVIAYADEASFEQKNDTITLTGNVRIEDKNRGYSTSDAASFNRTTGVYTLHNTPSPPGASHPGNPQKSGSKRVHLYFTAPDVAP